VLALTLHGFADSTGAAAVSLVGHLCHLYCLLQVCQYRCIVSYETPKFGAFALCILQLHNCRNLTAEIPMKPGMPWKGGWGTFLMESAGGLKTDGGEDLGRVLDLSQESEIIT
jgi:hypothetical protein